MTDRARLPHVDGELNYLAPMAERPHYLAYEPEPGEAQGEIQSGEHAEAAGANGAGLHDAMPLRAHHHEIAPNETDKSFAVGLDDAMPLAGKPAIADSCEPAEAKAAAAAAGVSPITAASESGSSASSGAVTDPEEQTSDPHGD